MMDLQQRIKELEKENAILRGATSQWGVIQKLLQDSNRRLRETEEKLQKALIKAEEGTKAKSIFLANMSHEIRTPLNGIIGMSDILRNTELNDDQKEYLNIILKSSDSLLQIINDILDFSKIEAGRIEFEKIQINIEDIISNVADILITKTAEKGVELTIYIDVNIPIYLKGDPTRIQQIVLNLANNAIKFTDEGEVYLGVELIEISEDEADIKFEVKDTGIGISKENQKKLFKSFSQTDTSTTRKYGGTGLGLAISKRLVEQMGGEIHIESEENKGTTFTFNIKLEKCKEQPKAIEHQEHGEVRILGVDDNSTNVKILEKYFEFGEFENKVINKPELAIDEMLTAKASGKPYTLAILDYQMPNIDGVMLAQAIKKEPELKDTKIVLLSSLALHDKNDMIAARHLFDATLMKPIKYKLLIEVIYEILFNVTSKYHKDSSRQSYKKMNIKTLIVDDNIINTKVATAIVSKFIESVDIAIDGLEACNMQTKNNYDLIFMDMVMPVMDGISATKKIREAGFNETKIIAMTANAMQDDIRLCLNSGMDDYISKPYRITEIEQIIKKYF